MIKRFSFIIKHFRNDSPKIFYSIFSILFFGIILNLASDFNSGKINSEGNFTQRIFAVLTNTDVTTSTNSINLSKINLADNFQRCEILKNPNLPFQSVPEASILGLNIATRVEFSSQFEEIKNTLIKYNIKYILGIVSKPSQVTQTKDFIDFFSSRGFTPVIRLCAGSDCEFNINDNSDVIKNFYISLNDVVSSDFIGTISPNEPGTGGNSGFGELENFGITDKNYDKLIENIIYTANSLDPIRKVNGGKMFVALGAMNLSNETNSDLANLGKKLIPNQGKFDYFLANSYNSENRSAYFSDFSKMKLELLEILDESKEPFSGNKGDGIKIIISEYGNINTKSNLKSSLISFSNEPSIISIMMFKPFAEELLSYQGESKYGNNTVINYSQSELFDIFLGASNKFLDGSSNYWLNCDFDSGIYNFSFVEKSNASSCTLKDQSSGENSYLKVSCENGNCFTKKQLTFSMRMPIKQFGSNTIYGTEDNKFLPVCSEANLRLSVDSSSDFLNQFAGKINLNIGTNTNYPMPWLGSAINCTTALLTDPQIYNLPENQFYKLNLHPGSFIGSSVLEQSLDEKRSSSINDEKKLCNELGCILKGTDDATLQYSNPYIPFENKLNLKSISCNGKNYNYEENKNNMIYGPEINIGNEVQTNLSGIGTFENLCQAYASRNRTNYNIEFFNTPNSCNISTACTYLCSQEDVNNGNCLLSNSQSSSCLSYNPEVGIFIKDTSTKPEPANINYDGIYEALYASYKRLNSKLTNLGDYKIIFRENLPMKAEAYVSTRDKNWLSNYIDKKYLYNSNLKDFELKKPEYEIQTTFYTNPDISFSEPEMIDNKSNLALGNFKETYTSLIEWAGYFDIIQEWNSIYLNGTPLKDFETLTNTDDIKKYHGLENITDEEYKKLGLKNYFLVTGDASLLTKYPLLSCDTLDLQFELGKLNTKDITCITLNADADRRDLLGEFLCAKGYDDICEGNSTTIASESTCQDGVPTSNTHSAVKLKDIILSKPFSTKERDYLVTQIFGVPHANTGRHSGIDYGTPMGTPILASAPGIVKSSKAGFSSKSDNGGAGTFIKIEHTTESGEKFWTSYQHLSRLLVDEGVQVNTGDVIGLSGNTGFSSGPHLHFELRVGKDDIKNAVDPSNYYTQSTNSDNSENIQVRLDCKAESEVVDRNLEGVDGLIKEVEKYFLANNQNGEISAKLLKATLLRESGGKRKFYGSNGTASNPIISDYTGDPSEISHNYDNGYNVHGPMQFYELTYLSLAEKNYDSLNGCTEYLGLKTNVRLFSSVQKIGVALCAGAIKHINDIKSKTGVPIKKDEWFIKQYDASLAHPNDAVYQFLITEKISAVQIVSGLYYGRCIYYIDERLKSFSNYSSGDSAKFRDARSKEELAEVLDKYGLFYNFDTNIYLPGTNDVNKQNLASIDYCRQVHNSGESINL